MLTAAATGMTANFLATRFAGAQNVGSGERQFTIALVGSAIGVKGTLRQQMNWASRFGYESIEPIRGDLVAMSSAEISAFTAEMNERGLQWAATYVPVNIREQA